jgi:hypothetical protein
MSALSGVSIPAPAVAPVASAARTDAQAATPFASMPFASVLDALPHSAAKARGAVPNAESSDEGDQPKPRRSAADARATLESALALNLPTTGPSASPAAIGKPTSMESEGAGDAHATGAVKAATETNGNPASLPSAGSAKFVGAKLVDDRTFHAAPSPARAATFAGVASSDGKASSGATAREAAPEAKAVPTAPDRQTLSEQELSALGSDGAPQDASLVADDAFVPNATKAAPSADTPHEDVRSGKPASRADPQSGRSAAMKSLATTTASSDTANSVRIAGQLAFRGETSAPHAPAASHETSKSASDPSTPANTSQPSAASTPATAPTPSGAGSAAAAVAAPGQIALSEAPVASASPTPTPAPTSIRASTPVREIDVDLAPGGLEDLSMTMRLAGDRLSVVIRAGSSQTAGAIETAREAITDRLAAIGQPLASLIIQQTGANTGETHHAKDSSSEGGGQPQGQSSQTNDQRGDRRGGASDRR